ncbi:MAG: zf-HC2 domain-containing protein [Planctomycetes bacterium]|nr:zf-HC2 domain-containing protein [Planctomycetota bacterium]
MECNDLQLLLSCYADGECTPEEARRVRDHLELCASCRATLEQWTAASQAWAAEEPEPASLRPLHARIEAELWRQRASARSAPIRRARRGVHAAWGLLATAAAVVLAVGLLYPSATAEQEAREIVQIDQGNREEAMRQRSLLERLRLEIAATTLRAQAAGVSTERLAELDREAQSILAETQSLEQRLYVLQTRMALGALSPTSRPRGDRPAPGGGR